MKKLFAITLIFMLTLTGCSDSPDDTIGSDSINWTEDDPNGTLTVINKTSKDVVLFHGKTPTSDNIIGGVIGLHTRTIDISNAVRDLGIRAYIFLCGINRDVYNKNKSNLTNTLVSFYAVVLYQGTMKFITEISPDSFGDYCFLVTNSGRVGVELRMNDKYGEKIASVPPMTGKTIYTTSSEYLTIFPIYSFYDDYRGVVTTIIPTAYEAVVFAESRPISDTHIIMTYNFSGDAFVDSLTY